MFICKEDMDNFASCYKEDFNHHPSESCSILPGPKFYYSLTSTGPQRVGYLSPTDPLTVSMMFQMRKNEHVTSVTSATRIHRVRMMGLN